MKKLFIMALAALSFGSMQAKVVGDTIYYNGKMYYIGPNKIVNGSFDNGFTGWYDGTSTTIPGTTITSTKWTITKNGGIDGNWLKSTVHEGKSSAGSLGTAWSISKDSIYYFSYYISNRNKATAANAANFQVVSATNTIGTETFPILGLGNNDANGAICGSTKFASGDTTWVQNEFTFDNTQSSRQYQYMQCFFRWQSSGAWGYDKFYLASLLDPDKISLAELVQVQFLAKFGELQAYESSADIQDLTGLLSALTDFESTLDDVDQTNVDQMKTAMTQIDSVLIVTRQGVADAKTLSTNINSYETEMEKTGYPGSDEFQTAIAAAKNVSEANDETTADGYAKAIAVLEAAHLKYRLSQTATEDTPANYTFFIKSPNFSTSDTESATTETSDGWIKGSTYTDGDQKVNFVQGHTNWNAWWSVAVADAAGKNLDLHQNLTGLPSGYYAISCLAITQAGCLSDQHAYVTSTAKTEVSPNMTGEGWDAGGSNIGTWDSLTTAKVLVSDGNLTIGFTSTKANTDDSKYTGDNREGWWCVSHFKLYYYGSANDDVIKAAYAEKIASATAMADTMHFAVDKKALKETIAANNNATEKDAINTAMANIATAMTTATKSENKYTEIMAKGKTIPTVTDSLAKTSTAYRAANEIVKYALDNTVKFINAETTTYTTVDAMVTKMKKYTSDYTSAYNTANDTLNEMTSTSAKDVLSNLMAAQKTYLTTCDTLYRTALIDTCINKLNNTVLICTAQNKYELNKNATDYTFMIKNANAGGTVNTTTGWTINRGKGNTDTNVGQHYSGNTSLRYFDSWNGTAGALNYYGYQVITGIPNGKYTVKAAGRTSGLKGAFIFASNGGTAKADTTWQRIDQQTYSTKSETTGNDTTFYVSDKYGKIWEEAEVAVESGTYTDLQYAEANANTGVGRGWNFYSVENYDVTNHEIVIGMCTDSLRTGEPFTGTWFSVVDFTLTKTADGDNTNWNGPITEVNSATVTDDNITTGVYNLSGMKMNSNANLPKGIYIVKQAGKTKKILVK
jgi:hypothetical protein